MMRARSPQPVPAFAPSSFECERGEAGFLRKGYRMGEMIDRIDPEYSEEFRIVRDFANAIADDVGEVIYGFRDEWQEKLEKKLPEKSKDTADHATCLAVALGLCEVACYPLGGIFGEGKAREIMRKFEKIIISEILKDEG